MKKIIILALCLAMTFAATACSKENPPTPESSGTQLANPFVQCDTLEAAAETAGFEMTAPETVEGYSEKAISAIKESLIKVSYSNGTDSLTIRKGKSSEDISGDYNQYEENGTLDIDGLSLTIKGNDGKINVAIWSADDYSFSITSSEGLTSDQASELVKEIN